MDKHEARLKWQREHRRKTGNLDTIKYEKTIKGFLMRKYRNMQSRVSGIQKEKYHLYKGICLLDRQSFYKWATSHKDFRRLFKAWVKSGYERKLCPSVNRIDPRKGYELSNMEWITHSENSRLGSINRHKMKV